MNKYLISILAIYCLVGTVLGKKLYEKNVEYRITISDMNTQLKSLESTYNENINKLNTLQANQREAQQQINTIKQKALKDVTRVEKIAKEKSKLYENLVNKDHQKTQDEFLEISK